MNYEELLLKSELVEVKRILSLALNESLKQELIKNERDIRRKLRKFECEKILLNDFAFRFKRAFSLEV